MDKLDNIKLIKNYFLYCLNEEVEVDFSVDENAYRIFLSDTIPFEQTNETTKQWSYLIFPIKDKFIKWAWNSHYGNYYDTDDKYTFNDFNSCIEDVIKNKLDSNMLMFNNLLQTDFFNN